MPKVYFLDQVYHSLVDSKTFEINLRIMPEYHSSSNCSHLIEKILLFLNNMLNEQDFDINNDDILNENGSQLWNPARSYTFNRECQRLYCDFFVKKKQFINENKNTNLFFQNTNNYQFDESDHPFFKKVEYCVELSQEKNSIQLNKINQNGGLNRKRQAFIQSIKRIDNDKDLQQLLNRTFGSQR